MSAAITLTALYVPADRPDRFDKAVRSGADVVMLDLEDAVAPGAKAMARAAAVQWLAAQVEGSRGSSAGPALQVRINPPRSPWFEEDLRALAACGGGVGVRLPKTESGSDVATVAAATGEETEVHALIESALGVERAYEIASHPAVATVCLGEADLASDLRTSAEATLDWTRSRIVVAARAAQLPSPMMSAHTRVDDDLGLRASSHHGRSLGFVGRTAIHPSQLRTIVEAFRPMPREIGAAQSVIAAVDAVESGGGVAVVPGAHEGGRQMVDRAMLSGARAVLDREAAAVAALLRIAGASPA